MAANINYRLLPCSKLTDILKSKGITYSNKKKEDLIHLCENAEALNLPDINKCADTEEIKASVSRRTVNGKTYPNPIESGDNLTWASDLSTVPSIDAYDITCFLMNYCGWTEDRVKRRKSDNSWQLHCSGHIHDVKMTMLEPDLCYLLGKYVPETKQSSQPYSPWVLVRKSGQILSAECTCVAGDGSCKHVAALLFGLADLVLSLEDRSTIGVTDAAAYWDKPRKVCRPIDVHNLDIRTDVTNNEKARASEESGYLPLNPVILDSKKMENDIIKVLKDSNTSGVCLYTLSDSEDEGEDLTMSIEDHPPNISDLITSHGVENVAGKITGSYIAEVNDLTKGQSENTMWQYQRKGRLTASNFYSASHYRGDSTENYVVKRVLGLAQFTSNATKHGKAYESIAREKYVDLMVKDHPSFQCTETGLFVFKDYLFLAASPDGIVKCKCCAKGLLEIKCPYTFHKESAQVAMSKSPSYIMKDGQYELKKTLSSPYYVQMLGQMGISNSPYCDFVLFTQKDLYIERVEFDVQHWEILLEKLESFYVKFVLPHLV